MRKLKMRYLRAVLAGDHNQLTSLCCSVSPYVERTTTTRRLCHLASFLPCGTHRAHHLLIPMVQASHDPSWLKQGSQEQVLHGSLDLCWSQLGPRTICSATQAREATVEWVPLYQDRIFSPIKPSSHWKMIKNYFNVSRTTAYKIVESDPLLKNCDVHTLARNINTLMRIGINAQQVRKNLPLLYHNPLTMENNHGIMRELGLHNLPAKHYLQFSKILKCTISALKTSRLLPEDYNPLETLLPSLGVPEEVIMNTSLPCNINQCTLFEVHKELSNVYLCWRLDCDISVLDKLRQTYQICKSITLQHLTLQQLSQNWSFDNEKVIKNGYLLACSPINIACIEREVHSIAGADIKTLVASTPRILTIPYHHLLQLNTILKDLGVTPAALRAIPKIHNLHPKTLQDRISFLREVPVLDALSSHPRALHLLFRYKVVTSRLEFLHKVKKTDAVPSLSTLLGSESNFHRYITVGNQKHNRNDVITCLATDMNESISTIKDALHFQAWEQHPTVISVRQNLMTLMKKGFTKSQVLSALDVVLYPTELVQDQLSQLPHRLQALPFSMLISDPHVLQILLYFMEKSMACIKT